MGNKVNRQKFVKKCIENPHEPVMELIDLLSLLNKSTSTGRRVEIIASILHVSPSTVWRDYMHSEEKEFSEPEH